MYNSQPSTDPQKLRLLAAWFDKEREKRPEWTGAEVQQDLRRIADKISRLEAESKELKSENEWLRNFNDSLITGIRTSRELRQYLGTYDSNPTIDEIEKKMIEKEDMILYLTKQLDKYRTENAGLQGMLWECIEWLESRPDYTEGDAATSSKARAALARKDRNKDICPKCDGTGEIEYYHDAGDHFGGGTAPGSEWRTKPCPKCNNIYARKEG